MSSSKRIAKVYVLLVGIALLLAYIVSAGDRDPVGPKEIAKLRSERMDAWGGVRDDAEAGNVTELFINATGVTQHWTGYFGNITGYITLDDNANHTLYDWYMAEPQGEIYATPRNPPLWTNVDCLNFTSPFNQQDLEVNLSMESGDEDGVNETFCPDCDAGSKDVNPVHGEFWVGKKKFYAGDCWAINTYVNSGPQSSDFVEVLLQDGSDALYMSFIEDDTPNVKGKRVGFDGAEHDFQMLVGENGNGSHVLTTTPYYFYVEIQ